MKTKKFILIVSATLVLLVSPTHLQAQIWNDLWDGVTSAFEDATKSAKEMLKQTVDIGGQTIDLGANAVGAATEQALNAQTAAYGTVKSINSKAFVYFKQAIPIGDGFWDIAQKISSNKLEEYKKLEESRQTLYTYGGAVANRMVLAVKDGRWLDIWDFANGMTGYLIIEPSKNCPRPLMAAIFIYDAAQNRFRAVSMNPNLTRGSLSYVYAAPTVGLNWDRGTNPDEVNPSDVFIGGVAQLDLKTNKIIWDYSGPCSVLQKSRWKVDFRNGEFITQLVADDGNIDSKPEKSNGILPKPDVPSSVNADMYNSEVPYCRDLSGVYTMPVSKGQIIRFGDIITLESLQYNFYLDADDDMCRPLGLNDGIDKQWQIIDPYDCSSAILRKPVRSQQMVALRSIRYGKFLDADDTCVTPGGGECTGTDKRWWFVNPDNNASNDYIRSGHVMGLLGNWKMLFLDADDNRCTADGGSLGYDKQWRIQLHPEYPETGLAAGPINGEYKIRVKANGRYLHEDGLGNKLVGSFDQAVDDFTHFILEKQPDDSYKIRVKADGRYLHEDGLGDKLVSTRVQPDDNFTRFIFEKQSDGSYKIWVKGSCRYLHEHGLSDRLISTRIQPDDDFSRFYLDN